LFTLTGPKYF